MTQAQKLSRLLVVLATVASTNCNEAASPTAPSSTTTPVTVVFESQLYPKGAASRTLTVAQAGSVLVTLTSVRPDSNVTLGLGLGIPRADGGGCHLSQSVTATSSSTPHLTIAVDPGTYCMRVYDIGTVTSEVFFSITIVHP